MTTLPDHVDKAAFKHSDPLYLSPQFLQGGHTSFKANGTATYVRYQGGVYCVTCAHIYEEQFRVGAPLWLTLHGNNKVVWNLGHYTADGYRSNFVSLRSRDPRGPDIAIMQMSDLLIEKQLLDRGKAPIDLDVWEEPDWSVLRTPVAFGFPTEHKSDSDQHVRAPFLGVVAELARKISPSDETFLMASSLSEPNRFFFSGMSGGAVYAIADSEQHPLTAIGIVFEGSPGSSAEWAARDSQSFMSRDDVQLRSQTMTPEIFGGWLAQAFST